MIDATFFISTSSSSATSIGRAVYVPCPISTDGEITVTLPSRSMMRKAFGAKLPATSIGTDLRLGGVDPTNHQAAAERGASLQETPP